MLWCSLLLISTTIFGQTGGATFENGPLMNRARIVPLATTLSNGNIAIFGGRNLDLFPVITQIFMTL